jgi:trimethylamine--corrinoid protein Co-methyltransferase
MILDDEMTGAIKNSLCDIPVNADTLAYPVMTEVGPGGTYIDTEHTAEHVRDNQWIPSVWTRESFNAWKKEGEKTEIERARDKYEALTANIIEPIMPSDVERELISIMK